MDDELVERVRAEMDGKGWSVLRTATMSAGAVSDQTIANWFRKGGPPTRTVRLGLAEAFGWDADWPENPPPVMRDRHDPDVLEELRAMRQQIKDMTEGVLEATEERRRLLRATTKALRVLVKMEARQLRAFALLGLDPSVDLDDSRLDDPTYAATLRAEHQAGRALPTARRRRVPASD